jgi:hypothetical protein
MMIDLAIVAAFLAVEPHGRVSFRPTFFVKAEDIRGSMPCIGW